MESGNWGGRLCLVCSENVVGAEEEATLVPLVGLLLKARNSWASQSGEDGRFLEETVDKLSSANYSLCGACGGATTRALESKSRAEGMEAQVRELQGKVLELMRELQQEIDVFQQELSRMGDVILGQGKKCKGEGPEDTALANTLEADWVREQILDVVTELRFYNADLQDKLILNRIEEQSMLEVSTDEVEVDFLPDVRVETEEEESSIDQLINYTGTMDPVKSDALNVSEEDVSPQEEESGEWSDNENGEGGRYVGHMVGLEEDAKAEVRKKLRRNFGWKEELPFVCNLCGERIATQNKLTRHLKRIHGEIAGVDKPEHLKRPAVRYNNEAVASEILSKALVCMTKNVEDKDRNTKSREERKRERQEKMLALRAQWKTLRKSMTHPKKKKTEPVTLKMKKVDTKEKSCRQHRKGVVPKLKYKTVNVNLAPLPQNVDVVPLTGCRKKSGASASLESPQADALVTVSSPTPTIDLILSSLNASPPPNTLEQETPTAMLTDNCPVDSPKKNVEKKKKKVKEQRPPLRRSTRGRCPVDLKEILSQFSENEKKAKAAQMELNPETES